MTDVAMISAAGSVFAILTGVLVWVVRAINKMSQSSFDKGVHSSEHSEINKDIGAAHRRLDGHDDKIANLSNVQGNIITKLDIFGDNQTIMMADQKEILKLLVKK